MGENNRYVVMKAESHRDIECILNSKEYEDYELQNIKIIPSYSFNISAQKDLWTGNNFIVVMKRRNIKNVD